MGTRFGRKVKGRVLHSQRIKEPFLEKRVKGHAAHHFNDARGGVDAALRVFPLFAGLILHRRREPERDEISERLCLLRVRTARFTQPGSVGEDLRDREIGRLARRGFQIGKLGQIFRHRIGDVKFALILQHENRRAGDRFRHRSDPEKRVGRHRPFRGDIGEAGAFEVEEFIFGDDDGDGAGNFVFGDHLLHRSADAGKLQAVGERGQRAAQSGGEHEVGEVGVFRFHIGMLSVGGKPTWIDDWTRT